jgi:hypothetical protein
MSWFRRKEESESTPRPDPRIEMARQTNQHTDTNKARRGGRPRATEPGVVDSEFCYGGDAGPCA